MVVSRSLLGKLFLHSLLTMLIMVPYGCKHKRNPEKNTYASTNEVTTGGLNLSNDPLKTFDEMKFGMFIHWGLYAVPAGEWEGKYLRGVGEWIMRRFKIPVEDYSKLTKQFNPVRFNPSEWAEVAEEAGMKYLVITSKHHDGFAMFDSKASSYNIVEMTPYGKDPMKSLSDEVRTRGLKFGFYYSQDQDWHEPNARGNTWDFQAPEEERDRQQYLDNKVFPQVEELLTNYGDLGLIWFDTPRSLSKEQVIDLRQTVKSLQPNCLINSRIGHGQGDYLQTSDNAIPFQVQKDKFEVCATLNDTWGFKKDDNNWKSPRDLIGKLIDIVSKGGNYLLNIGPTSEGMIPQESKDILKTVGSWMKANGEAIYGTRPVPFYYPDIHWRATTRPGKIYLHLLSWPGDTFEFNGLGNKVTHAQFLENKQEVMFQQEKDKIAFSLPAEPINPIATVIAMNIEEEDVIVVDGYRTEDVPNRIDLFARTARTRGEETRYDWKTHSSTNFVKPEGEFTNENSAFRNELWWYTMGYLEGEYEVEITYACENHCAGSRFEIGRYIQRNHSNNRLFGIIKGTNGEFVSHPVDGMLRVGKDTQFLKFALPGDDMSASMKVRKITLIKAM